MQLPPTDELVLVSACHPIRAKKARYYEDARLKARVLPPPSLAVASEGTSGGRPNRGADDWSHLPIPASVEDAAEPIAGSFLEDDSNNGGIRREPMLPDHDAITAEEPKPSTEFTFSDDEPDDDAARAGVLRQRIGVVARQAALDPDDGIPL
jgi:type IV secretion system protein VirD4